MSMHHIIHYISNLSIKQFNPCCSEEPDTHEHIQTQIGPPSKILDHLFLGSNDDLTLEFIVNNNIKRIINISTEVECPKQLFINDEINYMRIPITDNSDAPLHIYLKQIIQHIRNSIVNCETIFIHCKAGISRSPTVVIHI